MKEDKGRSWKLLRKFFTRKQLKKVGIMEKYDCIDLPSNVDDRRQRINPPPPMKSNMTDLVILNDGDILGESQATSLTFQPREEMFIKKKIVGPSKPVIREENQDTDVGGPTFEEETSSPSEFSSGNEASSSLCSSDSSSTSKSSKKTASPSVGGSCH